MQQATSNYKQPKSILITGASSGIGEALAKEYAAEGVTLFISGRNKERLDAVAGECTKLGATVHADIVDVKDIDAMEKYINDSHSKQSIDLVIANAGVGIPGETDEIIRLTFKTNIGGVVYTVLPSINLMKEQGHGQIAIVSSVAGYAGLPTAPSYSASKAMVKAWGEGLRGHLRNDGIKVSVICPGFVKSRITDKNTCHMPFMLEAKKAAKIIRKGLAKNKPRITFPWQMAILGWIMSALPARVLDSIAKRLPDKA
ncbi:MAG: SDR family NAD(P)-dependent oxidoreductase [Alphaproteobacteria bacterium]|nr:SDR family NAD(P)-dependent oxidoreductase [Alphaproteobacteria bacterium]